MSVDSDVDAQLSKAVADLSIEQSNNQTLVDQSNNHLAGYSTNPISDTSLSQSHEIISDQSIDLSTNQSVKQSNTQPLDPAINQSFSQPRLRLPISFEDYIAESQGQSIHHTPRVGLIYDARCALHSCNYAHVEQPARITESFNQLLVDQLMDRLIWFQSTPLSDKFLALTHSASHIEFLASTETHPYKDPEPDSDSEDLTIMYEDCVTIDDDTFANKHSNLALRLSAGSCVEMLDALYNGHIDSGFALVRPPGHHACYDKASGFCLVNNVAIATDCLINQSPEARIAIVDWDVHHGDGTQAFYQSNKQVLYISVHRYDAGEFYPRTGHLSNQGTGAGLGYSVNVPLNVKCGDEEYEQVFDRVIVPILNQFAPDVVIVSAGFDCARGDPLGGMDVTPNGFAKLTKKMMNIRTNNHRTQQPDNQSGDQTIGRPSDHFAPVMMVLEGGYNVPVVAESISNCVSVLLGDDTNRSGNQNNNQSKTPVSNRTRGSQTSRKEQFQADLNSAIKVHQKYWKLDQPVPITQPIKQKTNPSTKQQSTTQAISQPVNQSVNQANGHVKSEDDIIVEVAVKIAEDLVITKIVPTTPSASL